jgi:hypothetical protein
MMWVVTVSVGHHSAVCAAQMVLMTRYRTLTSCTHSASLRPCDGGQSKPAPTNAPSTGAYCESISNGARYVIIPHSKIGRRKSNLCWFWLRIIAMLYTCRKECNKYDLTAAQCFWLTHHNDWSRWFAISRPPPICCLTFSVMGGVATEYLTKLGCEKYFHRVTYWAALEMLWLSCGWTSIGLIIFCFTSETHSAQSRSYIEVDR